MKYNLNSGVGSIKYEYVVSCYSNSTIVFLHDSIGCIELWRDFPKTLAKHSESNYLVYDRIGFGKSSKYPNLPFRGNNYHDLEADILLELLNELKVPNPILFGHSDGGTIALIAAAKKPQLVKGVLTEAAHVFVEDLTLKGIKEAKYNYLNTNLREKLFKYHEDRVDDVVYAWTDIWLDKSFRNWNIEKYLPQIICPSLIIQGDQDEYGTLMQVESIMSQVSGKTEKLIIPNVGHTPHREDQITVLQNSTKFIRKLKDAIN